MSETTHTPGPWSLEQVPIQSRGGSNTCWKIGPFSACIYDDWRPRDIGIFEQENRANAYLIAAAPDLLAACKAVMADCLGNDSETMCVSCETMLAVRDVVANADQ